MNTLKKINYYFVRNRIKSFRITLLTMFVFIMLSAVMDLTNNETSQFIKNARLAGAVILIIISVHSLTIGFISIICKDYLGKRFVGRKYGPIGIGIGAFWIGMQEEKVYSGIEAVSEGILEFTVGLVTGGFGLVLLLSL